MTELVNHSTERSNDAAACAIKLLHHYGFDLGGYRLSRLLIDWQQQYPTTWIRLAAIEALYQGRYKAVSVEQILAMWQRRSQPLPHFNHEFERLVCANLPDHQVGIDTSTQSDLALSRFSPPQSTQTSPYRPALQLPRFEGSPQPEADVMLALRTLHSKEMAALQEAALAETVPPETPQQAQADDHPSTQIYSYNLRSHEPASSTAKHEHTAPSDLPMPGEANQPIHLVKDNSIEDSSKELASHGVEGKDADTSMPQVSNGALPDESFAALNPQPDDELALHQATETSASLTLPTNEAQAKPQLPPVGAITKILQQLEHQELKGKAELPALELIASTLRSRQQLYLTAPYQPMWLIDPSQKQPIHQFTPTPEVSDFHSKLKAVAQPLEEPQEGVS